MFGAGRALGWVTQARWLRGASMARILLGNWAIYYYLLHYPVRGVLWGPGGVWPFDRFAESALFFNPLRFSASPLYFELLYHGAIVVALAYTLGVWTRLAGLLHWIMIWSLQERNLFIGDGGDNLMRIVLLFLVLADMGRYLSIDALRRREPAPGSFGADLRAVAHNCAIFLVVAQLALLYASTGLYKVMGEVWQSGTALYYILRVDEFSWPGVAEFVYRNSYLVVLGTYGTILFELSFLPALFNRWAKYLVMAVGLAFHVGIALFMGLITFSWSMLGLYPLLLNDQEYRGLSDWWVRRFGLTVLYDGWCPVCSRSVRCLARLDLFSLVQFVSFRDPGNLDRYHADPVRAERRVLSSGPSGRLREGIDVMIQIAVRSVLLWPTVPVLVLGRLVAGQRFYDAVAARRLVLVPGNCATHCAIEEGPMR